MLEAVIFISSVILGSFANNVISYYAVNSKFDVTKSKCFCEERFLSFLELIPIFSYIILKGRCRCCKIKLPARYPIIEIVFGVIGLLTFFQFGFSYVFIINIFTFFLLILIAVIDLEIYKIPNIIVLSLFVIFIFKIIVFRKLFLLNILSALLFLGVFLLINNIILRIVYKEVIGYGDIKLISILILFQNIKISLLTLWSAAFLAIPGFYLMKLFSIKNYHEKKIPFGFFLSIAFIIVKLNEKHIVDYFSSILSGT